jgi:hypothetical protein
LLNRGATLQNKHKGQNATANANANARIHANSNSVFGAANNQPSYNKKDQPKKDEIKVDKELQKIIRQKNKKNS